ncbi:MAG: trypsin-like serine protease [Geitlerinemataceae cyanobacterium]
MPLSDLPASPVTQTPRPRVSISSDNINDPNFLVQPGQGYDGVVLLEIGDGTCTGALLEDGLHILTAAHCFDIDDNTPDLNPDPSQTSIRFDLPTGSQSIAAAQIFVHPDWTSGADDDNDLAIIRLAEPAPEAADRYAVYTDTDEVGKTFTRVGYGVSGTGNGGEIANEETSIKRFGTNIYDALGDVFTQAPASAPELGALKPNNDPGLQLAFDFDNGNPANDAFARDYGIVNPVTDREIGSSRGDSGGPAFIDGKIAGVASYGTSTAADINFNTSGDADPNNTSFGELFADVRVSSYLGWIGATLGQSKSGDDTINGSNRNDTLFANAGNDTVTALGGNDLVLAGRGNDTVAGGDGDDLLGGNRDNDTIDGGAGNDAIVGGQQDDIIAGGAGNDTMSGDRGSDTLTGGDGADVFQFSAISDIEIVTDFTDGVDRLSAVGLTFADLTIANSGSNTLITSAAAPSLSVTLQNVSAGAIDASDFL